MTQPYAAVGVVVSDSGVSAGDDGRKIVKAGTPLAGDLTARTTAFTQGTDANAVAVLVHDVDVTNGSANGTALVFGFVDKNKLDTKVQTLWTSTLITRLSGLGIKLLA